MPSWSCGNLLVTVLLCSCRDRISVSIQVELNQFFRAVRRKRRGVSTQIGTGLVRRVLSCIKIILRKPWFFAEEEIKMKCVHIKLLIYMLRAIVRCGRSLANNGY